MHKSVAFCLPIFIIFSSLWSNGDTTSTRIQTWLLTMQNKTNIFPSANRCEKRHEEWNILRSVPCSDPGAIYGYTFSTVEKLKRNFVMNGVGLVKFNKQSNFGIKYGKCLKVFDRKVVSVEGNFVNDKLEGQTVISFVNRTHLLGNAQNGQLTGIVRYLYDNDELIMAVNVDTGRVLVESDKNIGRMVIHLEEGHVIRHNDDSEWICRGMVKGLYVNCSQLSDQHLTIDPNQLTLKFEPSFISIQQSNPESTDHQSPICPESLKWSSASIREKILNWQSLFNYQHVTDLLLDTFPEPLDLSDPRIEQTIPQLVNRASLSLVKVSIISMAKTVLYSGTMSNGTLSVAIDKDMALISDWKDPVEIRIAPIGNKKTPEIRVVCRLNRGKFHGLVVMFGQLSNDPTCCDTYIYSGISFIGNYHHGVPSGICWKGLIGGSFIYGKVDASGHFSGTDIAYIYPDFKTALRGTFSNGLMVSAQESEVLGVRCHEAGQIMELRLSEAHGPSYHYNPPNETSLGDQPLLGDPLDNRYVFVDMVRNHPQIGEGLYAKIGLEQYSVVALIGGMITQKKNRCEGTTKEECEDLTKFDLNLEICKKKITLPKEYRRLSAFRATVGQKVNHSFIPNSHMAPFDSARFGRISSLITIRDIKQGEELSINYRYMLLESPLWYRKLFIEQVKEFPSLMNSMDASTIGATTVGELEQKLINDHVI